MVVNDYDVELIVDDLLVDGYWELDVASLRAAIQDELVRLFTERGIPTALSRHQISANLTIDFPRPIANEGAQALGTQVAHALYGGLAR